MQLILSPGHGWEDIARARVSVEKLRASGFYPLTALTALSAFLDGLYHEGVTLTALLIMAMVTFVMFFVGYFFGVFALSMALPRLVAPDRRVSEKRIHTLSLYCTSLLELVALIQNAIPITMAITLFLPIYVLVVIYKGADYLHIAPENRNVFTLVGVVGIIAAPYLLQYLFNLVLVP